MIFKRYGRSYQLKVESGEDLENVVELNEAHWVATSAPVEMMNCDVVFLQLLDEDNKGRILCREVKGAVRWLLGVLCEGTGITAQSTTLRLGAVDADTDEGQQIRDAAREVLSRLGEKDGEEVTLEQVRQIKTQVESTSVSEAGVVLPEAAADGEIRQFITEVIETVGGTAHPSGAEGVGTEQLTSFLENARAYLSWYEQGHIGEGGDKTDIMPLGSETSSAYATVASVRDKINQYFAQCVALSLDERFAQRMGWTESELEELDFDDAAVIDEVLKKAPLAKARPDQQLRFNEKINPYYVESLGKFRSQAMQAVLGKQEKSLSADQWQEIKAFFGAHHDWIDGKAGAVVEPLGVEELRKYLNERFAKEVQSLISESKRTASVLNKVRLLEKLILYQAYMIEFINNFVSFPRLYDTDRRAMFEMGSLVMDGRRFKLAVRAGNRAEHKAVASSSSMYVLYVEICRPDGDKMEVVVPVTSGGKGNLRVGKRGVFCDILGNECDARVVDIIANPISVGEALISPFQRLGRLLVGKIESITTTAEKKLDTKASSALEQLKAQPAAAGAAPQRAGMLGGGLLMGAGVAVAALGSAMAYITKTLAGINPWVAVAGIVVAVLAVMLPISIVAFLKLRRRDLSAILEGSGWGINARMCLTHK